MLNFNSNTKLFLIILVAVSATFGAWYFVGDSLPGVTVEKRELPEPDYTVTEYSLSGLVKSIDGNNIVMDAEILYAGNNGNYVVTEEKSITVGDETVITKLINVNGQIVTRPGAFSDIVIGIKISVYSPDNIAKKKSFSPSKLDIIL